MAIYSCRECGKDRSSEARACPHCGAREKKTKWWLWVPVGTFVAVLGFGFIANARDPDSGYKSDARRAIDLCWSEQKRKSLDPSSQRFVAGACELMERNFTTRFGHTP